MPDDRRRSRMPLLLALTWYWSKRRPAGQDHEITVVCRFESEEAFGIDRNDIRVAGHRRECQRSEIVRRVENRDGTDGAAGEGAGADGFRIQAGIGVQADDFA